MDKAQAQQVLGQLLEELAAVEHERWSHWQRYLLSKCQPCGIEGDLLIPAALVKHWEKQIATPYADLPEMAKESDRDQVRKYLPLIVDALSH